MKLLITELPKYLRCVQTNDTLIYREQLIVVKLTKIISRYKSLITYLNTQITVGELTQIRQ